MSNLFSNYWPGNTYVDVIGPDIYNVWWGGGGWPGDSQMLTNINTAVAPAWNSFVTWAQANNKALCMPELGGMDQHRERGSHRHAAR